MKREVPCNFCGMPVATTAPGTYQFTSGWVKNRTAGGGNAVSLPQREDRYACGPCIDKLTHNISPFQGSLV